MSVHEIEVTINGKKYKEQVESRLLLSDFLRETCGLTGTHVGCEHGVCGACTIHLNGSAVRSCLIFAVQVDGQEITTVEGLGEDGQLTPLQKISLNATAFSAGSVHLES